MSVIDTATGVVSASIDVGARYAVGVAITPDGTHAYVANRHGQPTKGTVSVIDTATGSVSATITVGWTAVRGGDHS